MKTLDLPDHPRTIAYRLIVRALRDDPAMKSAIHPDGWNTYIDQDNNDAPPGEDTLPSIEILPFGQGASPQSPIAQYSPLGIAINVATDGADVGDLLNLWGAVENALFPGDGSRKLGEAIRAGFAGTGAQYETLNLSSPAITPTGSKLNDQVMVASGTLTVMMRVRK